MSSHSSKLPAPVRFVFDNSLLLIAGTLLALVWANVAEEQYLHFVHWSPFAASAEEGTGQEGAADGETGAGQSDQKDTATSEETGHGESGESESGHGGGGHPWNLHFFITDLLMALFFAIAAKEVWESMLPGGALSNVRKASMPLLATLGGVIGPAGLYVAGTFLTGTHEQLGHGWAVPCATDIAFSYLVARIIFGVGHPAIAFLLLLAIADDAAGLIILAIFYPQGELHLAWLLLTLAAIVVAIVMRKQFKLHSFWWYLLIPGVMSWISFERTGIHAALGLVPIVPFLPHAHTDLGIYARQELKRHDTLNEFEHFWKYPVEVILGLFGLVNAGVAFTSAGIGTVLVLVGLLVGKPLGISLFTLIGDKLLKLEVPQGMNYRHVVTLGMVAGLGFTVALFVSTAAFPVPQNSQATLDSVKMGALASFAAAPLGIVLGKLLRIRRNQAEEETA